MSWPKLNDQWKTLSILTLDVIEMARVEGKKKIAGGGLDSKIFQFSKILVLIQW
jgi:hypothetical protein